MYCVCFIPQTNTFQAVVITDFTTTYSVFIYKCRNLQYSASATIGFTSYDDLFENHRLSGYNARNIACINSGQSNWVNLIYKLTREDLQAVVPIGMYDNIITCNGGTLKPCRQCIISSTIQTHELVSGPLTAFRLTHARGGKFL